MILPTTGSNGTNVVWYSSDESVINPNNGVVTRPTTTGDVVVTLTALISLPEYEGKITKTFNLTVKTFSYFPSGIFFWKKRARQEWANVHLCPG